MDRYICIHGHFYQPPRENPWLEEIEHQDSAFPYCNWNERITSECYAPNTASRILNPQLRIIDIFNNFQRMSFNFGPTLLSWMERFAPEVYQSILEADKISQKRFSGHGAAIAQAYNHMIMPLANDQDKRTQILWGIKDFEYRFKRKPEGLWLPETAVDLKTLEILVQYGIKFTILAPNQAGKVRKIGDDQWQDVNEGRIDPKKPYLCRLPSQKTIVIFFYDGAIAKEVAFDDLLNNGEHFAKRMHETYDQTQEHPQLAHIATDGETYGHHHHLGDMALAYCLQHIESNNLAQITVYGEYLEKYPPDHEVEIIENSSWSCSHGVERWKANCGCVIGTDPSWSQEWRCFLREAMDWLRDQLASVYEKEMSHYVKDPWTVRDFYIELILDRSVANVEKFFSSHFDKKISGEVKIKVLKLLEMQRHAMLMFTSCGWFFDELSRIETQQIMQYAARAIQLAEEVGGTNFEPQYVKRLSLAKSNLQEYTHGGRIYRECIKPAVVDFLSIGAHYAISSIFENFPKTTTMYSYEITQESLNKQEINDQKLVSGKSCIRSEITWEQQQVSFAVLYLGTHDLRGGIKLCGKDKSFDSIHNRLKESFSKKDITKVTQVMNKYLGPQNYSLWHIIKNDRGKILNHILDSTLKEIETHFQRICEKYDPIMQINADMRISLPKPLAMTIEFILIQEICQVLESNPFDCNHLEKLVGDLTRWSFEGDKSAINVTASKKIHNLMKDLAHNPEDMSLVEIIEKILHIFSPSAFQLDLWWAQNIYFSIWKRCYQLILNKAKENDSMAKKWVKYFDKIGIYLNIKIEL